MKIFGLAKPRSNSLQYDNHPYFLDIYTFVCSVDKKAAKFRAEFNFDKVIAEKPPIRYFVVSSKFKPMLSDL